MAKSNRNSYGELKAQLDEILLQFQDENLDIDKSTELYEKGLKTIKQLEDYMKKAENKIKEIQSKFDIEK